MPLAYPQQWRYCTANEDKRMSLGVTVLHTTITLVVALVWRYTHVEGRTRGTYPC